MNNKNGNMVIDFIIGAVVTIIIMAIADWALKAIGSTAGVETVIAPAALLIAMMSLFGRD